MSSSSFSFRSLQDCPTGMVAVPTEAPEGVSARLAQMPIAEVLHLAGIAQLGKSVYVLDATLWDPLIARCIHAGYVATPREGDAADTLDVVLDSARTARVVCSVCGRVQSTRGSKAPMGAWCVSCDAILHYEMGEGVHISVEFYTPDDDGRAECELRFALLDYDPVRHIAYLDPHPFSGRIGLNGAWCRAGEASEDAQSLLDRYIHLLPKGMCTTRSVLGAHIEHVLRSEPVPAFVVELLPHAKRVYDATRGFRVYEADTGQRCHHHQSRTATWIDGQLYEKRESLPVPEAFVLVPAFAAYPLVGGPDLGTRILHQALGRGSSQLDRYLHTEHERRFSALVLDATSVVQLSTFVRHFTTLDIVAWDAMMQAHAHEPSARRILAIAAFCHPQATVLLTHEDHAPYVVALDVASAHLDQVLRKPTRLSTISDHLDMANWGSTGPAFLRGMLLTLADLFPTMDAPMDTNTDTDTDTETETQEGTDPEDEI